MKEEIIANKYRLTFGNYGYQHLLKETGENQSSSSAIHVEEGDLPTREIFIALPVNTKPAVQFTILRQTSGNNALQHQVDRIPSYQYSVKGYVWMDDYYCVHISVNPLSRSGTNVSELQEFSVEFSSEENIFQSSGLHASTVSNSIIDNPQFGPQWKSQHASFRLDQTDEWIDYSRDYVKLGVARDGIYRIKYNDLLLYGVPIASLNPQTLRIFLKGKELPIYVSVEKDNVFNQEDYIEFLGRRNYGDVRYR
ncbi:MAG: hypothetical protein HYV29_15530, partial [Ignavibacteriales bacterium]|nr:hypothetical protein [Ignavibacteriales bacterium]